jgi:uncharacterized membrane protein
MINPANTRAILKFKIHWHVVFIHFPISFFMTAFGFQILHLFMAPICFELATNIVLSAAAAMMIPTVWSGCASWKKNYNGAKGRLFQRKIAIGFGMLFFSVLLVSWRTISFGFFAQAAEAPQHWIYLVGNTALIVGAIAEGSYGGRLNHR